MRRSRAWISLLAIACLAAPAAAEVSTPSKPGRLMLADRLPRDPLALIHVDRPADILAALADVAARFVPQQQRGEWAERARAFEAAAGLSLQRDVLGRIGPQVDLVIDLPPLDEAAAALQLSGSVSEVLFGEVALLAEVRDPVALSLALRHSLRSIGAEIDSAGSLKRVRLGAASDASFTFYYRLEDHRLAAGLSPEGVLRFFDERPHGSRLLDGEDFSRVAGHLDRDPSTMVYVNLPKLRDLLAQSRVVQLLLETQPALRDVAAPLFDPEMMATGIGWSSVRVEGGVRTTHFGPGWTSGAPVPGGLIAALAFSGIPRAVEDARARETVDDIRVIAEACNGFSDDVGNWPGPTKGWVPVDWLAIYLEPVYVRDLPRVDAWEHPILYWSDGTRHRIVSTGPDGRMDLEWSNPQPSADAGASIGDVVFGEGRFLIAPGAPD